MVKLILTFFYVTLFFSCSKNKDQLSIKPQEILDQLFNNSLQSVIIEWGTKTLQNFIDKGYWDEARVFTSNKKLKQGIPSPKFVYEKIKSVSILDDKLDYYFN